MDDWMAFADTFETRDNFGMAAEPQPAAASEVMSFGRFEVLPAARALLLDGENLVIGGRAFDLLVVLLRSRGRVVTKQDIMQSVWPTIFVDESNLRFQMGMLRKALRHERGRIKTIAGRGYLFAEDEPAKCDRPVSCLPGVSTQNHAARNGDHVVVIIDQDPQERAAIAAFLRTLGRKVMCFASVDQFGLVAPSVAPVLQ